VNLAHAHATSSPLSLDRDARAIIPFQRARRGELLRAWQRLAEPAPPFLDPELVAIQLPLAPPGEPIVACARRNGALVGVIPLVRAGRTLLPLRTFHSQLYDFLGDRDAATDVLGALAAMPGWDRLIIKDLPERSPFVEAARALDDGSHVVVTPTRRCPVFALDGFEERLTAKFRANLRRCARKVPDLVYERFTHYDRALFDEALRIEALAWKAAAGSAIASDPKVEHAYRAIARLTALRGEWSLSFLRVGDRRVAVLFAVEAHGTLYAMKIGYDPAFANVSIGHLIVWNVARDAQRRGLSLWDFLGHEDEWKSKWTDDARSYVTLHLYRPTARGHVDWALREVVKPRVSAIAPGLRAIARSREARCQRQCVLGEHGPIERVVWKLHEGLGIRSGIRRALHPEPPKPQFGHASRFLPGTFVRVRTRDEIERTLDAHDRLRGLQWVPSQWEACGRCFRVDRQVLRLRDDHGRWRPVSGTTLLEGVTCAGASGTAGCGRHCPLMFRDEWLEPIEPMHVEVLEAKPGSEPARWARVRSIEEIRTTLDERGMRDGLLFTADGEAFAGQRLRVAGELDRVFEHDRWLPPRARVFMLEALHCSGTSFGDDGPCHRACALLWHEDWLELEPT
jgi:CelD/BcsL family acetyltransferase involved in cellulose biosynthesis